MRPSGHALPAIARAAILANGKKVSCNAIPPCHAIDPCCGQSPDPGSPPNPNPTSTLAVHLCGSNRFGEKRPFPPWYAVDFSYRSQPTSRCAERGRLPAGPRFANRFPQEIGMDHGCGADWAWRHTKTPANSLLNSYRSRPTACLPQPIRRQSPRPNLRRTVPRASRSPVPTRSDDVLEIASQYVEP